MTTLNEFIHDLPKAELHLHIEGTLEPELLFKLAERNQVELKYPSVEALKQAYNFSNLQEFLDLYYEGANVLLEEQDFYDLTWAYLLKCKAQNVVHTEIFFDPQTHTDRGVLFATVINGINRALQDAKEKLGISSQLIMCFLRHLDEASAFETLEEALDYKDLIVGVGLDSSEKGNPPAKFERVFAKAREEGFLTVAHAGEEGPAANVKDALDLLKVIRVDHGISSINDPELVAELAQKQIPLTVCPLSNLALKAVDKLQNHPLKKLMDQGVLVTINSDDPAYFGGYMNENYQASAEALGLTKTELVQLTKNSFVASLLSEPEKERHLEAIEQYADANA
ncbi:adenosine deaminase [uncultured Sunxiuqinia sp.]|uniref:adenosine deaminase n=1 Tax=uncultured Sunxiuqinia sp. TaxID=1573825 RepID=UPI002627FFAE|nr:adenosine deaminase [uncultured Sunxiuqinia sp.]